jgi:hypothetical protein
MAEFPGLGCKYHDVPCGILCAFPIPVPQNTVSLKYAASLGKWKYAQICINME